MCSSNITWKIARKIFYVIKGTMHESKRMKSVHGSVFDLYHFKMRVRAHTRLWISCPEAGAWVCKFGLDSTVLFLSIFRFRCRASHYHLLRYCGSVAFNYFVIMVN